MALSQVTPTLFLSGADAPLNAALMSQKGITLIVNATLNHTCPTYLGVECVRVPVPDLPSARLGDHFDRVAERIHSNRSGGTLVHCAAGMSRSPALVMAYLMRFRGVTLQRAHHWVRDSRPHVRLNTGFWEQLLQYERRLYGTNTIRVAPAAEDLTPPRLPQLSRAGPPLPSRAGPPLPSRAGPPLPSRAGPPLPSRAGPPLPSRAGPPLPSRAGPPLPSRAGPPLPSRAGPPLQQSSWLMLVPKSPLMSRSQVMSPLTSPPASQSRKGSRSRSTKVC